MASKIFSSIFLLLSLYTAGVYLQSTTQRACQDDTRQSCWSYEDSKCIGIYEPWSRRHCPYRCGYCPELPPCMDTITNCDEYTTDMCSDRLYGLFARQKCRKYCDLCTYPGRNATATTQSPTTVTQKPVTTQTKLPTLPTGAACQDQNSNCDGFSRESCQGVFRAWAIRNCPRTCGYCTGEANYCADYEDCSKLPDDLCQNQAYATVVRTSCRKFCGLCTVKATTQKPVGTTKFPAVSLPQNYTDKPPVAVATDVVIDYPDTTAVLNASLSHDDLGITDFKWDYLGNLNADIRGQYTDTLQLYDLEVGTYEFRLTVTDTSGQTDTIMVKVEVVRANNTCELDMDEGLCNAYIPRFFYNMTSMSCDSYVYGGCFGNSNNFETEQQCREYCLGEKQNVTAAPTTPTEVPTTAKPAVCSKNFDIPVPECCGPICACNHTVEGYVTDAANNATPLANVSVYVSGCYCHPFSFSDDNGYYTMSGLCQDDNTLRFETEGYRSHLETPKDMGNGQYQASAPMEPLANGQQITPLNPGNAGTSNAPLTVSNANGQNGMVNPGNVLG